jgi:hypothetical protein
MSGSSPLAPWHLWGTSVPINTKVGGLGFVNTGTGQLARVNYARPETWRFLFGFQFLTLPPNDGTNHLTVVVDFDLIIGVGRSSIQLLSFAQFFRSDTPSNLAAQGTLWTTATWGSPVTVDRTAGTPVSTAPLVDTFVAQDIQCAARVRAAGGVTALAGKALGVQAHAYFSPNVHIRPEWFTDDTGDGTRFRGGENGGT